MLQPFLKGQLWARPLCSLPIDGIPGGGRLGFSVITSFLIWPSLTPSLRKGLRQGEAVPCCRYLRSAANIRQPSRQTR